MTWITLTVSASGQQADALGDALMARGALSIDVHDADADTPDEQALFGEPGEPGDTLWRRNRIVALFPEKSPVEKILHDAAQAAGLPATPEFHIGALQDDDWVRLTQAQFDPIPISPRLWIVPTWHTPADPAAINIALDPGLAFGTGSHPTTRLCLRWLDENLRGGETVLDYGCGSGILAIAALKLGAASAVGVDLDPQAVRASRDNAAANGVTAEFHLPDDAPPLTADVVVANILTNPLKLLAPLLASATRTGGRIVLSGILAEQADDVMKIYSQWCNLAPSVTDEGWARVSGVKR
ncbi:MAG: 50S ribosomal protein L11 methyltransferase [Gallionellaceae bacterium]|jgi:ribosomal protein L11 methyltransferase|nr:50S ribosomal protein L11 methyltransferase [Gallionellaceae bacterium]